MVGTGLLPKVFRETFGNKTTYFGLLYAFGLQPLAQASIKTYFNHDQSHEYQEPYRKLRRPGRNLEEQLIEAVQSAKSSLWIAVQEIRLPNLAKAIAQKKTEGIDVRLIIENSYNYDLREIQNLGDSKKTGYHGERNEEYLRFVDTNRDGEVSHSEALERDAIYLLKNAKVSVIDDTSDSSAGSGLMHHKFMVVDSKKVVVTSANFTMSDVHGDFSNLQSLGNANSLMVFEDVGLAKIFEEEFLILWGSEREPSRFGVQKPYRGPQTLNLATGETVTVQFSGTSRKRNEEDSTIGLIAKFLSKASTQVDMALFVFSEGEISKTLQEKHEQLGLDIRAVIEPTFAYRNYSKALDMWGLQLLPQNCRPAEGSNPWTKTLETVGVPELPKGDFLHHKFAVVDGRWTIVGSHNWSRAASENNDETLLVIEDSNLSSEFQREFSYWYQGARLGAPQWLVKESAASLERCR